MNHHVRNPPTFTLSEAEDLLALGGGAALLLAGAWRRNLPGTLLALASAPLLFRGVTGRWPAGVTFREQDTRQALSGDGGILVNESVRLERPIEEVYRFWRRLENLPTFMSHLIRVTETDDGRSHWVASGPGGVAVEWDAEILNDIEHQLIAWRSLPGSDVLVAGAVNFDRVRDGRSTQVSVRLQYAPPSGRAGALVASLFGRAPSQTVREDLRRFKQMLEAGEVPRATATS